MPVTSVRAKTTEPVDSFGGRLREAPREAPEAHGPRIANLSNAAVARRVDPRYGFLDLEFDFEIAGAEADLVVIGLEGFGEAINLIAGCAGRTRGRARVGQTVILCEPGVKQRYSVRLFDRAGQHSNRLEGSFVAP